MDAYTGFAEVYDAFMDNIPYEEWCAYLIHLLKQEGVENGIVLELGCGTGSVTERLAMAGYDMIGVDASEDMLSIALEKREREELAPVRDQILYLCQDMREFELYGTVKAAVSICDSINYITSYQDLVQVFRLVNNYLDPGAPFIFDLNTWYKYENILGDNTFAEAREESSFIWENFFDEESGINEYDLTLFIREDADSLQEETKEDGEEQTELYRRYTETHFQKAYSLEEIRKAAEEAGMVWVCAYDAFTEEPARADSERVYIILREQGKE